jgi:hypothetical protein
MVPSDLQNEVYRTVKQRGEYVDATWAPWWRAQAEATRVVLEQLYPDDPKVDRLHAREIAFAVTLEGKTKA